MDNNQQLQKQVTPLKVLIKNSEVQTRFQEMLGSNAPSFLMSVLNATQTNEKLAKCDPQTILMAAAVAATLKLPIDPNLGLAYIIPYNEKIPNTSPPQWRSVAQFQIGYKGLIALCHRTNEYHRINAKDVREGEIQYTDHLTGDMAFNWEQDHIKRDKLPIIGYVSYFRLQNGFEKMMFMPIDKVEAHAKKYSKTYKNGTGIWAEDKNEMSQKTVLKLLLGKYGPKSVELMQAIKTDQSVIEDYEGQTLRYADNEQTSFVPKIENDEKVVRQRILNHIEKSTTIQSLEQCQGDCNDEETLNAYNQKLIELTDNK